MSEVDIAYKKSPLSSGRHGGARWDPRHYAGPPPGAGPSPRFLLYAADAEKAASITKKFATLVEATPRPSPDRDVHLVRPDGYVGLTARADDWDKLDRYLQELV